MHFMRAAWPLIPSEKASIETAPRAKIRCCCSGCFRNSLIGMAWDDCGIRIIARKSKTSKRCMGCLRNCCTDYRADDPCPSSLASFSRRGHDLRLAVFGEQVVQRLAQQVLDRDLVAGGAASLDRQFSRTLSTGGR